MNEVDVGQGCWTWGPVDNPLLETQKILSVDMGRTTCSQRTTQGLQIEDLDQCEMFSREKPMSSNVQPINLCGASLGLPVSPSQGNTRPHKGLEPGKSLSEK